MTFHLISLGCDKNLVDSEVLLGVLSEAGYVLVGDPSEAGAIVINTCGFIEAAVKEGIQTVLEAARQKDEGICRALVVTGCMAERYKNEILAEFPEVDAVVGAGGFREVLTAVENALAGQGRGVVPTDKAAKPDEALAVKRVLSGAGHFAYLKIAEGCNHVCAYCAIPLIRGKYRSRPQAELVAEARTLVASGIREICVVAQDITAYGKDLRDGATSLVSLLHALDDIPGTFWIRLLYGYPNGISDDLLAWMARSPHACRYLDIPLQHSHPDILRAMRRAETIPCIPDLASRLRAAVPDITLRTTFLVGFPGENEDHFAHLRSYIATSKFDHVGIFA